MEKLPRIHPEFHAEGVFTDCFWQEIKTPGVMLTIHSALSQCTILNISKYDNNVNYHFHKL